jgi:RimJ/RimL family protein N-acetyltransferase
VALLHLLDETRLSSSGPDEVARVTDPPLPSTTDGLVLIRAPVPGEAQVLVAGRDEAFYRWLGPGADEPRPAGCIHAGGQIVGWVDYDLDRDWLEPGEVNVGYHVFAPHRGRGYATRAVRLLLHHLSVRTGHTVASLLIDPANQRSLALAARIGAVAAAHPDDSYFRRPVPPLSYSDGVVTSWRTLDASAMPSAIWPATACRAARPASGARVCLSTGARVMKAGAPAWSRIFCGTTPAPGKPRS